MQAAATEPRLGRIAELRRARPRSRFLQFSLLIVILLCGWAVLLIFGLSGPKPGDRGHDPKGKRENVIALSANRSITRCHRSSSVYIIDLVYR